MSEQLPAEPVVPLPTIENSPYAEGSSQPWRISLSRQVREEVQAFSQEAILSVLADSVTDSDHSRCMMYLVKRRFRQLLIACVLFLAFWAIFFALIPSGNNTGIGLTYAEEIGFFAGLVGLIFCIMSLGLLMGVRQKIGRLKNSGMYSFCVLSASPQGIHDITGVAHALIPWNYVRSIYENHGDLFIYWKANNENADWAYLPRRAFKDQAQTKRFCQALTALQKSKGDPEAVSPELRAEFTITNILA